MISSSRGPFLSQPTRCIIQQNPPGFHLSRFTHSSVSKSHSGSLGITSSSLAFLTFVFYQGKNPGLSACVSNTSVCFCIKLWKDWLLMGVKACVTPCLCQLRGDAGGGEGGKGRGTPRRDLQPSLPIWEEPRL